MIWPFTTKAGRSEQPRKLPFRSGAEFLEYQCKYGHTKIEPKQGIVALVLDASKEFGTSHAVNVEIDGRQTAVLKVASTDGGFVVMARTMTDRGDRLRPGDVVIWVPETHSSEIVPSGMDDRFGWVGFIAAKVKPEIDLANLDLVILSRYS